MAAKKEEKILGEDLSSYYKGSGPQEDALDQKSRDRYDRCVADTVRKLQFASNQKVKSTLNQLVNDPGVKKDLGDAIHKLEADIMRELERIRSSR